MLKCDLIDVATGGTIEQFDSPKQGMKMLKERGFKYEDKASNRIFNDTSGQEVSWVYRHADGRVVKLKLRIA